jgi:LacI family transcriptional regulator
MTTGKPSNLEDIAAKAGVSRSTVSRVINDEPYVSEKTRQRVLKVIEQEGFSPNPAARMLVTQRTNVIGVVFPHTPSTVFADDANFYPQLLQGATEAANERDYAVLLWLGLPNETEDALARRVARNRLMDGLIIASVFHNGPLIELLIAQRTPFVQIERSLDYPDQVSYVSLDNARAAEDAVRHLLECGRRRVGTITGTFEIPDVFDRYQGYLRALESYGIAFEPGYVAEGNYTQRSGFVAAKQLINHGVDAIFAATDLMALGALEAIAAAGLHCPDDVAVVGFDDIPAAARANPPLTTVRQNVRQRGARSASLLIDLVSGAKDNPTQILIPTQLVIRASSGAMM